MFRLYFQKLGMCVFISMSQSKLYTAFNQTKTLKEWGEEYNIPYISLKSRTQGTYFKKFKNFEELLTLPFKPKGVPAEESIGKTYQNCEVLEIVGRTGSQNAIAKCKCLYEGSHCKGEFTCSLTLLRNGVQKSCGCYSVELLRERSTTHGLSRDMLYITWDGFFDRCYREKSEAYAKYGGRGIKVCDEWKSTFQGGLPDNQGFINFYNWARNKALEQGISIDELYNRKNGKGRYWTIERMDFTKGYSLENCKWADRSEQSTNQRDEEYYERVIYNLKNPQWNLEYYI